MNLKQLIERHIIWHKAEILVLHDQRLKHIDQIKELEDLLKYLEEKKEQG